MWEKEAPLGSESTIALGGLGWTSSRPRRTGAADTGDKNYFCIVRIGRTPLPRSSEDWSATAAAEKVDEGAATKEEDGDDETEERAIWEVQLDSGWVSFDDVHQSTLETEHKVSYMLYSVCLMEQSRLLPSKQQCVQLCLTLTALPFSPLLASSPPPLPSPPLLIRTPTQGPTLDA